MKHTDVYACHKVKIRREIMVHHIVLWNWKEGLAEAEKGSCGKNQREAGGRKGSGGRRGVFGSNYRQFILRQ